jgi:hypothetical protein
LAHSKKKVRKLRSIPKSAEKSLVRFPSSVALSSPLSQVSSLSHPEVLLPSLKFNF